jgi:S-adenosylmethionine synthetase
MPEYTRFYDVREFLFTSESVSEGHPDKVADQISDTLLDEYLRQDPFSRVAIETLVTTNKVVLAGEIRAPEISKARIEELVRNKVKQIGYEQEGFHWENLSIENYIHEQSREIAQGVDSEKQELEGAGDQGLMFGYACRESEELMPAPINYSHKILRAIFTDIKSGKLKGLGPDAKSQVTLKYKGNDPVGIHSIVLSIQHNKDITQQQVRELIFPYLESVFPSNWEIPEDELYINPTGSFIIGGPDGDAGLTGRKIIVDTYGGAAPHGGGAFSGKDPSKVDRSAAYMARYLAKNIVASGQCNACTIQLSYAIGVAKPLAFYVNLHGTGGNTNEYEVAETINQHVDLTPWGLRKHLDLHKPIYEPSSAYGHFGRKPTEEGHFSWEKLDLADKII